MSQNISLLGASYSDVPSVLLPKTGGGTAQFDDTTIASNAAAAGDIASGKLAYVNGALVTGTASGGGGASNVVTGTFKGTTTGAAMDVTLAYTGSGYPIVVVIYPTGGIAGNATFNSLVQRYAAATYFAVKRNDETPSYPTTATGSNNTAVVNSEYKNSTSSATNYTDASNANINLYADIDTAGSGGTSIVKMRSKTKMSVYIANTSYGFAANIEYTYHIIYSS